MLVITTLTLVPAVLFLMLSLWRWQRTARELQVAMEAGAAARRRSEVLLSVTEAVNSSLALNEVLDLTLSHAGRLVGAVAGGMYMLQEDGRRLQREESFGLVGRARGAVRQLDEEPVSSALGSPQPEIRGLDEDASPGLESGGHPTHVLALPVRRAGSLMGIMELYFLRSFQLTREQVELLQGVAAQAATAIRHAQLYREQEENSLTDELTQLPNRRYLAQRYLQETERARRHHKPLAFLMLDIDNFKQINDTRGHLVGDSVLAGVAAMIARSLRKSDVGARYGGEEFAVILPETNFAGAVVLSERLRAAVQAGTFGPSLKVTISIGVAATSDARRLGDLIELADQALYRAKENGRNQVCATNLDSSLETVPQPTR